MIVLVYKGRHEIRAIAGVFVTVDNRMGMIGSPRQLPTSIYNPATMWFLRPVSDDLLPCSG